MEAKSILPSDPILPVIVEKEEIPALNFPAEDVLKEEVARISRKNMLRVGMRLGNAHRRKIKIHFEDAEGLKKVETTIWATTEKNVVLKRGALLPIHRIREVKFY